MFKTIWQSFDGKKLWTAIIGAVALYGIPYARVRWWWLPWDEVLIPMLTAFGVVGIGHKAAKWKSKKTTGEER